MKTKNKLKLTKFIVQTNIEVFISFIIGYLAGMIVIAIIL